MNRASGVRMLGASLGLLVMLAPVAPAMDPDKPLTQHVYEHWDSERGLPQNSVNAIEQTPDGFLWLGTFEGAVRFDGSRMHELSYEVSRRTGAAISRMWRAPDDALWIGSFDRGLSRLIGHDLQYWGVDEGLPTATVTAISGDAHGNVWVGTSEGVARIVEGRLEVVEAVPRAAVRDIAFDRRGRAWVALRVGGVMRVDGDEAREVGLDQPGLISNALLAHPQGGMWVGTSRGLYLVTDTGIEHLSQSEGLAGDMVNKLVYDSNGALWVGFNGEGVQRIQGGHMEAFGPGDGLANGFVQALFEDDFGSLWIGTNSGVVRLRDGMVTNYGRPEGLPGEFARTVTEDTQGRIWAGLDDGGVVRIDATGELMHLGPEQGLAGSTVRAIHGTSDGAVWIGVYGQALQRLDPDGSLRTWRRDDGLPGDLIRLLMTGPDGSLLIGSEGAGLVRFHEGRFDTLPGTEGLDVRAGLLDDDGHLLLGTYSHGLLRMEPNRPARRLGAAEGFPWTRVMSLYRDRNGHLWIGTQQGLARHDGQRTIEFEAVGPAFSRAVFFITEDRDGSLWFTGNNGITQIPFEALATIDPLHDEGALQRLRHRRVDAVDGLRSRQINGTSQPAGLRTANGWLWFPTGRGLAALDPTRMMAPEPPPRIFIEDIVVQGEMVPVPPAGLPLLHFPPGTERIEFLLSGIQGLMPDSPLVQTRLIGFDDTWGPPSLRRDVLYAALPPGRFRFEARALSPRGTPGLEPAVLEFAIQPTLAQRGWFWPAVVLLTVLLATTAILWRAHRLRQRTQGLERSIAMRTLELREKNQALETALEQVEHISRTDTLTGVHNRRFLESIIGEQARQAERNHHLQAMLPARQRRGLVLLVVDIDFFKEVNDRHGHAVGDEVLKAFASMLRESVRGDDLVVRWGGEEFVVLMRESSLDDGIALARRIIGNARQTAVQVDGLRIQRTCSVGLACHPFLPAAPGSVGWGEAIDVADQAMYQAKARGRDGWVALLAPEDATDPGLARRLVRDVASTLARGDALMEAERREAGGE